MNEEIKLQPPFSQPPDASEAKEKMASVAELENLGSQFRQAQTKEAKEKIVEQMRQTLNQFAAKASHTEQDLLQEFERTLKKFEEEVEK